MRSFVIYAVALVLLVGVAALVPEDALLRVAGLPGHPLMVHAPAVLLPLGAIAAAVLVLWPRIRERWHLPVLTLLGLGSASALLAKKSGEAFLELSSVSEAHQQWGTLLSIVAPVALLAALGFVAATLYWRNRAASLVAGAVVLVMSVGTLGLTVAVGHSGAESVWGWTAAGENGSREPGDDSKGGDSDSDSGSDSGEDSGSGGSGSSGSGSTDGSSGGSSSGGDAGSGSSASPSDPSTPVSSGYTLAEVSRHNSLSDCWTAIDGKVYDLTSFARMHPGGASNIERLCGIDGTSLFLAQHGGDPSATGRLAQFEIGNLVG